MKGLRLRRAKTLEQANEYLENEFLPEWNQRFTVTPRSATDAHRSLGPEHQLPAILSHVEQRTIISNDYTLQLRGQRYQIAKSNVRVAMRGQKIRVEARLDGSIVFRYQGHYLAAHVCTEAPKPSEKATRPVRKDHNRGGRSQWMTNFHLNDSPVLCQNLRAANSTS